MRKALPLPDGGALVINSDRLRFDAELHAAPAPAAWGMALHRWLTTLRARRARGSRSATLQIAALAPLVLARKLMKRSSISNGDAHRVTDDLEFDVDTEEYHQRMADLSWRIAERVDPAHVVARRRENYEWLVRRLDTSVVTPIHPELPDGVSPWFCPVISDDPDALSAALYKRGIAGSQMWLPAHPDLDWDAHPREMDLKRRIIALPTHQDVDRRQLQMIADAIRSYR